MSLARYDLTVQDAQGRALSGAVVYFCGQPANTTVFPPTPLAVVFSDLSSTVLTQPAITDGFGHTDAYLAVGSLYTVVINHPLFATPLVYIDQYAGGSAAAQQLSAVQASTLSSTISGAIPGSTFTLPSVPLVGSLVLDRNGMVLTPNLGYTITGAVITLATPIATGEGLNANYLVGS